MDVPFPNDDVPLSPASLVALLGDDFRQARWLGAMRVALRSRNRLYRIHLAGAPQASLILKVVRQEDDRFWQHHVRREHWLLELLQRFWPGGAPRPYAALFGQEWGLLMMEDAGEHSLAEAQGGRPGADAAVTRPVPPLVEGSEPGAWNCDDSATTVAGPQITVLTPVLARLADLHSTLVAQQRIFYRVCQSVDLDRITTASLLARACVSHTRLRGGASAGNVRTTLSSATIRAYQEGVIRPLVTGRRQMIHNSLSPLNVVLGLTPCLVDWETMAYAAPEFDLADLLRFPATDLPWVAVDRLVAAAFGSQLDLGRLRLAALARALDYAGSNAEQVRTSHEAGDTSHAATAASRRDWYVGEARTLAAELGLAPAVQAIVG